MSDELISRREAMKMLSAIVPIGDGGEITKALCQTVIATQPIAKLVVKTADVKMNWASYHDEMGVRIVHVPYAYRCGECDCKLEKTHYGRYVKFCPCCGAKLDWGEDEG